MNIAEEEARKKWCPFASSAYFARDVDVRGVIAANRIGNDFDREARDLPETPIGMCPCIASKCMAWRRAPADSLLNTVNEDDYQRYLKGEIVKKDIRKNYTHGHCGLAGPVSP